jgi:hypothetical protein
LKGRHGKIRWRGWHQKVTQKISPLPASTAFCELGMATFAGNAVDRIYIQLKIAS